MTLREIDQAIQDLIDELLDPETGALLDEDGMEFELLQMAREEKIKNTALYFRQLAGEAKVLADEITRLQKKKKVTENKMKGLKYLLDQTLRGQKFHHPLVDVSYRKSTYLDITNENAVIAFCQESGHLDCLKQKPIEISTSDITRLIKDGVEVPGAEIAERYNLGVK